jgi:hypothetical protein
VKYVTEHGLDPGADISWGEFEDFLKNYYSDL